MIDPMANLDAGVPGSSQSDEEKDIIDFMSLRYNLEKIDRMKSVMSIASGCLAGICGLTGLQGLVCMDTHAKAGGPIPPRIFSKVVCPSHYSGLYFMG